MGDLVLSKSKLVLGKPINDHIDAVKGQLGVFKGKGRLMLSMGDLLPSQSKLMLLKGNMVCRRF